MRHISIEDVRRRLEAGNQVLILAPDIEAIEAVEPREAIARVQEHWFPIHPTGLSAVGSGGLDDHDHGPEPGPVGAGENLPLPALHIDLQEIDALVRSI